MVVSKLVVLLLKLPDIAITFYHLQVDLNAEIVSLQRWPSQVSFTPTLLSPLEKSSPESYAVNPMMNTCIASTPSGNNEGKLSYMNSEEINVSDVASRRSAHYSISAQEGDDDNSDPSVEEGTVSPSAYDRLQRGDDDPSLSPSQLDAITTRVSVNEQFSIEERAFNFSFGRDIFNSDTFVPIDSGQGYCRMKSDVDELHTSYSFEDEENTTQGIDLCVEEVS